MTGLIIDPYFSSTKLAWLLSDVPQARVKAEAGELCFGTVDSFLIWKLTKGARHVTDATNASRTQLFDITANQWSSELADYFAIPLGILPEVHDCVAEFGIADAAWFGAEIPILGVAGDQQAALIGQACFKPGMSKSTYGTGCFVMTHTGAQVRYSKKNLLATIAYRIDGQTSYALEGSIFVKWLRDQMGLIEHASDTQAAYERTEGDAQGVYVVPGFTGLGAPHWRPDVRGLITGLTLNSDKNHIITAFLQSVAFQTETLLSLMAEEGAPVDTLRVDGGMVVNEALCQFLSDILQVTVERPADIETTAKGAGVLAAIGCGVLKDLEDAATHWRLDKCFQPAMTDAVRGQLLKGYNHALSQALSA
jgi:glycerol kinase